MPKIAKNPIVKLSVLFICTGNTCRSPMAEYIFKDFLKSKRVAKNYTVQSAGLFASVGDPMSAQSMAALDGLGVKYEKHSARPVTVDLVQNADVIVCMTQTHRETLLATAAYVYGCGDNTERIVGIASELIGKDIADPYGQSADVYKAAADEIATLCDPLYGAICSLRETLPKFNLL